MEVVASFTFNALFIFNREFSALVWRAVSRSTVLGNVSWLFNSRRAGIQAKKSKAINAASPPPCPEAKRPSVKNRRGSVCLINCQSNVESATSAQLQWGSGQVICLGSIVNAVAKDQTSVKIVVFSSYYFILINVTLLAFVYHPAFNFSLLQRMSLCKTERRTATERRGEIADGRWCSPVEKLPLQKQMLLLIHNMQKMGNK